MNIDIEITPKQQKFITAQADEVLFGGAAGGGKSYGQVVDALLYALKYPGSKQIIFRKTYKELEQSIIRTVLALYPRKIFKYNSSKHSGTFINGSILDFGYCDAITDINKYQSAEFDVIRFDELTHFVEEVYIYLISRLRGANNFPKSVKSSTNPGSVGHTWVKDRFIDIGAPDTVHTFETGTRIFIPSKVQDNHFLMESDPNYVKRLENLSEKDKKALLYGDWDIFDGQYFGEFKREIHTCRPFEIPSDWRRYRAIDYGLDCLACIWVAINSLGECYVYREYAESNKIISDGAKDIVNLTDETVKLTYAPPDLWGRSQESGKSRADLFHSAGLSLIKSTNDRVAGWMCIKEMLKPNANGDVKLHIFDTCTELIKCITSIQYDDKNSNDCATQPHDITHLPDALRYFAIQHYRPNPKKEQKVQPFFTEETPKNKIIGQDLTKILRR
jgi:phage terminase large subunit